MVGNRPVWESARTARAPRRKPSSPGKPIDAEARLTRDAELGYEVIDGLEITVGAQNLLDTYPTESPFAGIVGAQYGERSPFGFNGGSYYIRGRFQF